MNALQRALIEKAGYDHGFEHVQGSESGVVHLASARHVVRAMVQPAGPQQYVVQLRAPAALLQRLQQHFPGQQVTPDGFLVREEAGLGAFLQRTAELALSMPREALQDYEGAVAMALAQLPAGLGGTEVERLVRQRLGQERFRAALLDYWGGACSVSGVAIPEVLRASHAKPWAECSSDAERLDVCNGFLLHANLDALFDRFLVSFDEQGCIMLAPSLDGAVLPQLGIHPGMRLRWLALGHRPYLEAHRARFGAAAVG